MSRLAPPAPILALLYSDGRRVDPLLAAVAGHLRGCGLRLAGFVQREAPRPGRSRCDMVLEDLSGDGAIAISEDRGAEARGCRLDLAELTRALALGERALAGAPDLLIVNKFGKAEAEGGGFRPLIAAAAAQGTPALVAAPWRNIEQWRAFVGDLAIEHLVESLPADPAALCAAIGLAPPAADPAPRLAPEARP